MSSHLSSSPDPGGMRERRYPLPPTSKDLSELSAPKADPSPDPLLTGLRLFGQHNRKNQQHNLKKRTLEKVRQHLLPILQKFLLSGLEEQAKETAPASRRSFQVEILRASRQLRWPKLDLLVVVRDNNGLFVLPRLEGQGDPSLLASDKFCGLVISIDNPFLRSGEQRRRVHYELHPLLDKQLRLDELERFASNDWSGVFGQMLLQKLPAGDEGEEVASLKVQMSHRFPWKDDNAFLVSLPCTQGPKCLVQPSLPQSFGGLQFEGIFLKKAPTALLAIARTEPESASVLRRQFVREAEAFDSSVLYPGTPEMDQWVNDSSALISGFLSDRLNLPSEMEFTPRIEALTLSFDRVSAELLVSAISVNDSCMLPSIHQGPRVVTKNPLGLIIRAELASNLSSASSPSSQQISYRMPPFPSPLDTEPMALSQFCALIAPINWVAGQLLTLWRSTTRSYFHGLIQHAIAEDLYERMILPTEPAKLCNLRIEPILDDESALPTDFIIYTEHQYGAHVLQLSRSQAGRINVTPFTVTAGAGLEVKYFFPN